VTAAPSGNVSIGPPSDNQVASKSPGRADGNLHKAVWQPAGFCIPLFRHRIVILGHIPLLSRPGEYYREVDHSLDQVASAIGRLRETSGGNLQFVPPPVRSIHAFGQFLPAEFALSRPIATLTKAKGDETYGFFPPLEPLFFPLASRAQPEAPLQTVTNCLGKMRGENSQIKSSRV
jgi:hypothetical protein